MKISEDIQVDNDQFNVSTMTKSFFATNPRSSVIPALLNGSMTAQRGFQIHYSTSDEAMLRAFHEALCVAVKSGNYAAMLASVRSNQVPSDISQLAEFVTGFKY